MAHFLNMPEPVVETLSHELRYVVAASPEGKGGTASHREHKRLGAIHVDRDHRYAVEGQEHPHGRPGKPLVAVDEGMILTQQMQERGGLARQIRVCLLAERHGSGPGR